MFIETLFTIAKCGSKLFIKEDWIKRMWYIYIMNIQFSSVQFHLSIKRNTIVPFAETWTDLETVIQTEVNQKKNIV